MWQLFWKLLDFKKTCPDGGKKHGLWHFGMPGTVVRFLVFGRTVQWQNASALWFLLLFCFLPCNTFFFFPPARHHKCTGIAYKRRKTPCQQGAGRVLGKTCIQPLSLTKSVVISELFLITYWSLVDLAPYKSSFLNGSQLWLSSVPGQRRISSSWWLEEVRSERERTWVAELQVAKVLGRVSRWLT